MAPIPNRKPPKSALIFMTLQENLGGQLVWVLLTMCCVGVAFAWAMSGTAPAAEAGFLATTTALLSEGVLLAYGLFQGASLVARDFTSRGLCELLVPHGVGRSHILLARVLAHLTTLGLLAVALSGLRYGVLFAFVGVREPALASVQLGTLGWVRGCVVFTLATWLGAGVRPLLAQLGTAALFLCGHYTGPLATVQGGISRLEGGDDTQVLGPLAGFFLRLAQVWDPTQWVVPWNGQSWDTLPLATFGSTFLWPLGFSGAFLCFALGSCRSKPILGAHT